MDGLTDGWSTIKQHSEKRVALRSHGSGADMLQSLKTHHRGVRSGA